jgi:hypothetical protein
MGNKKTTNAKSEGIYIPYIERGIRESLKQGRVPTKPGELNYLLSQHIRSFIAMNGKSYTTFNAVAGVLSCLSMEVYRRLTAKYEDEKFSENGEVF